MPPRDILLLEENTQGKDYIMADLHGNADCLAAKLMQLQPEDRLFIAGDLTDRGSDSPRVVQLVLDYQAKHPNRLYVVRGNHEDVNAFAISAMADYFEDLADISYSETNTRPLFEYATNLCAQPLGTYQDERKYIHLCLLNGGFWLLELFRQEMQRKLLWISESGSLRLGVDSLVAQHLKFISKLPYIIHVKGRRPFTIVHADMPLTHAEMFEKLARNDTALSEMQKHHAMNARTRKLGPDGALLNTNQTLVNITAPYLSANIIYAGHNVINNQNTFVTRPETHTVVVDVMAWKNQVAMVVCHTDSTCEYVGRGAETVVQKSELLKQILEVLSEYLTADRACYEAGCDENLDGNSPAGTPKKRPRSREPSILTVSVLSAKDGDHESSYKLPKCHSIETAQGNEIDNQSSKLRI